MCAALFRPRNAQNRYRALLGRIPWYRRGLGRDGPWPRQKVNRWALGPDPLAQCGRAQPAAIFGDLNDRGLDDQVALCVILGRNKSGVCLRPARKNLSVCETLDPGTVGSCVDHDAICKAISGDDLGHGSNPKKYVDISQYSPINMLCRAFVQNYENMLYNFPGDRLPTQILKTAMAAQFCLPGGPGLSDQIQMFLGCSHERGASESLTVSKLFFGVLILALALDIVLGRGDGGDAFFQSCLDLLRRIGLW